MPELKRDGVLSGCAGPLQVPVSRKKYFAFCFDIQIFIVINLNVITLWQFRIQMAFYEAKWAP